MATKKNVNVTNAGSEKVDTEIRRRKRTEARRTQSGQAVSMGQRCQRGGGHGGNVRV